MYSLSVFYAVVQIGWSLPTQPAAQAFVIDTEGINSWQLLHELTGLKNVVPRIGRGQVDNDPDLEDDTEDRINFPESSRLVAITLPSLGRKKRGPPTFRVPDHWRIGGRKRSDEVAETSSLPASNGWNTETELMLFNILRLALQKEEKQQAKQRMTTNTDSSAKSTWVSSRLPMRFADGFRLQSDSDHHGNRYKRLFASVMDNRLPNLGQVDAELGPSDRREDTVEDVHGNMRGQLVGGQTLADLWPHYTPM